MPRSFSGSSEPNIAAGEASSFASRIKKKRKKPGAVVLGRDKGMYRKTDAGYKKRRFTLAQRQTFRAKRQAPSWGPDSGRPR